jgi:hypothetical protein
MYTSHKETYIKYRASLKLSVSIKNKDDGFKIKNCNRTQRLTPSDQNEQ